MQKPTQEMQEVQFQISELLPIGFTLVVAGLGIAYGLGAMSDAKADMTAGTDEYAAVANATEGVLKLSTKFKTIAGIAGAAIVIGILITYLWVRR